MAENAIISDLEFAPQLTDDMVLAVEDTKNTYSATLGALRGQLNKLFIEKNDVDFDTLADDGFYQVSGTLNHQPIAGEITWLVQVVKDGTVIVQNAFGTDATNFSKLFVRRYNGTSWSSWTNISASGVDLSTKANTDLSNINASGKSVISTQGKPSSRMDTLTIGAYNTQYKAPDNGWYDFEAFATAPQGVITIINITSGVSTTITSGDNGNPYLRCYIPAKESDTVLIQYASVDISEGRAVLKFIYDEGVK